MGRRITICFMQSLTDHRREDCPPDATRCPQTSEAQHHGNLFLAHTKAQHQFSWLVSPGKVYSLHLLRVPCPGPFRPLHSAGGWGRWDISISRIRNRRAQRHGPHILLPTTWPLDCPQLQGKLGNVGGCVPWRQREMRTIHPSLPLTVTMTKVKWLPLVIS